MPELQLYQGHSTAKKEQADPLGIETYLPSDSLIKAVQLAQILRRPLLVKGEPGCGKSRLAEAVAAELFGLRFREYYFEWNIKSSSKAQDGLYLINNLQRLSDANFKTEDRQSLSISLFKDKQGRYHPHGKYIDLGVLGQAFLLSQNNTLPAPPVVLIDEIDKADIDFPNDLLLELDRMEFEIPEIIEDGAPLRIKANLRPLFIITSNDEKPLPPAFLRRCLFHYIEFRDIRLTEIVRSKFPLLAATPPIIDDAIKAFTEWRKKIAEKGTSSKNITTGELLDWVRLIDYYVARGEKPVLNPNALPEYHQALLKDPESIKIFASNEAATAP